MEEINSNFIHEIIDADLVSNPGLKIHTRFPPEPNGYLHIGSVKAICVNTDVANKYNGLFNLRYDDTNPAKESDEFVRSIREDLEWLGAIPTIHPVPLPDNRQENANLPEIPMPSMPARFCGCHA